jgi:molybdate transport system substrate-binding protein
MSSPATAMPVSRLSVFCAGAAREAITRLAGDFGVLTGNDVALDYGTVGALKNRVAGGEIADIVVVTADAMAELVRLRKIVPETVAEIGRVGVGIAVRSDAPAPDISTPEALRQTLLAAASVAYPDPAKGATSGIHFAKVLDELGIAGAVNPKSQLSTGGFVVETVAAGAADIGVQQITEILPVAGVKLVGPLPANLQKITAYAVGMLTDAPSPALAAAFLGFLAGERSAAALRAAGFGQF